MQRYLYKCSQIGTGAPISRASVGARNCGGRGRYPPLAAQLVSGKKALFDQSIDGLYRYVIPRRHFGRLHELFCDGDINIRCSRFHVLPHWFVGAEIRMPPLARVLGQGWSVPWQWLGSCLSLTVLSSCAQQFSANRGSPRVCVRAGEELKGQEWGSVALSVNADDRHISFAA